MCGAQTHRLEVGQCVSLAGLYSPVLASWQLHVQLLLMPGPCWVPHNVLLECATWDAGECRCQRAGSSPQMATFSAATTAGALMAQAPAWPSLRCSMLGTSELTSKPAATPRPAYLRTLCGYALQRHPGPDSL